MHLDFLISKTTMNETHQENNTSISGQKSATPQQNSISTEITSSCNSTTTSRDDNKTPVSAQGPRRLSKGMRLLPSDFTPSNYSVLCGRGKGYYNSFGNRRLRVIIRSFRQQYTEAEGSAEKALVVTKVMDIMKQACPVGGFIKIQNGRYYELSERAAREKCSALFRDCMVTSPSKDASAKRENTKDIVSRHDYQRPSVDCAKSMEDTNTTSLSSGFFLLKKSLSPNDSYCFTIQKAVTEIITMIPTVLLYKKLSLKLLLLFYYKKEHFLLL
jgi:hypothetical protein